MTQLETDLPSEIMEARRQWITFNEIKEKTTNVELLYLKNISFRNEAKQREFIINRTALQEMLKEVLQAKVK